MKDKFIRLFNLNDDIADINEIDRRFMDGAVVRGANLYILIFAIIIASVGLNMNSTAVVIGAMLISPLMGVIMNFSFAIASQDFFRARRSILKLVVQVIVSILTSTIYFAISPLNTFSSELMARTMPTFWDVLIAFFGGFSAIIALTRKNPVSNVIPGAAIATALMPPLCTVGYCLSQAEWIRALGAIYLFTINAVFICVSGILGLYIMNVVDVKGIFHNVKQRRFLALTIIVAIIPSTILAWHSVCLDEAKRNYNAFLNNAFVEYKNTEIVKSELSTTNKTIDVFLMGEVLEEKELKKVEEKLPEYELEEYALNIIQTDVEGGVSREELNEIINKGGFDNIISLEEAKQNKKMLEIITSAEQLQKSVSKEILTLYPDVVRAGFTQMYDENEATRFTLLLEVREKLDGEELANLKKWLNDRFEKEAKIVQVVVKK